MTRNIINSVNLSFRTGATVVGPSVHVQHAINGQFQSQMISSVGLNASLVQCSPFTVHSLSTSLSPLTTFLAKSSSCQRIIYICIYNYINWYLFCTEMAIVLHAFPFCTYTNKMGISARLWRHFFANFFFVLYNHAKISSQQVILLHWHCQCWYENHYFLSFYCGIWSNTRHNWTVEISSVIFRLNYYYYIRVQLLQSVCSVVERKKFFCKSFKYN